MPAERLEELISARRIGARVGVLARRIDADYAGRPIALLVVLKGASVFASDLMRRLANPCTVDFVSASSYRDGTRSTGSVAIAGTDAARLAGRHVLVIEDILDTGLTSSAILASLRRQGPASLALCALLRKPAAASLNLPAAYVGFDIPDEFVVGYGMDYAERYRNLPGIHRLILARS